MLRRKIEKERKTKGSDGKKKKELLKKEQIRGREMKEKERKHKRETKGNDGKERKRKS